MSITDGGNTTTFIYDGEGKRGKRTEGGATVLYVNKYYEKNLTTGVVTTYYFLGDRLVLNVRQLASLGRPLKPGKRGPKPRHEPN